MAMTEQQENLKAAFIRTKVAIGNLSSRVGELANLTTTEKTSIVAAINEVKASIQAPSTVINDAVTATGTAWSSAKVNSEMLTKIADLLGGADGASDTLKELSDQITALAQADNGLLSFASAQTLTAAQQLTACTNLGIGDPTHNFVADFENGLASGL